MKQDYNMPDRLIENNNLFIGICLAVFYCRRLSIQI